MTDVLDAPTDTAAATSIDAPQARVEGWLGSFDEALTSGDAQAAAEMFVEDSYWRDLVAFTWNITTAEGRAAIVDMLTATLPSVAPSNWRSLRARSRPTATVSEWSAHSQTEIITPGAPGLPYRRSGTSTEADRRQPATQYVRLHRVGGSRLGRRRWS
jgi:hypothetical protein